MIKQNTKIRMGTRYARVSVGGTHMCGVIAVGLSRSIVERAGPDGWVERRADGDTLVTITLPLHIVEFVGNDDAAAPPPNAVPGSVHVNTK